MYAMWNHSTGMFSDKHLDITFENSEDNLRFINILCAARKNIHSQPTLDMIDTLSLEMKKEHDKLARSIG